VEKREGLARRWKGGLFLLGGLLIGVLFGVLILLNGPLGSASDRRLPPTVGAPAPDFSLQQLGAGRLRLSDLKGKPVIINFWATWCAPCKEEMPLLDQAASRYSDELIVLGVNAGEAAEVIQPYIDSTGINFPILLDSDEKLADLYFVRNFPMTFFVDSQGVLQAQHIGLLQETSLSRYLSTVGINP
jgi:thiol-disulfide isomerase/thioredoxin